jgi:putative ABC transport system permease protein
VNLGRDVRFVLRMAWRETRASWARLLFFFVCVAIGVAAIIVLRSVVQHVRITLTREARSLIGADLVVQSSRAWTADLRARIAEQLGPRALETSEVVETQTMAAAADGRGTGVVRLVELRGVEARFPFYGTVELDAGKVYSHELLKGGGALVQPEFLIEMGLHVGDELQLAGRRFTIRGVVTRDRVQRPGGGIAFGPRVYVDLADLRATSLIGFGSRATHGMLARVEDDNVEELAIRMRRAFVRDAVVVRSWRGLEDRLGQNLTMAENDLSLVGFAIVVLGGIGVWSVTRVLVQQKIRSVAVLKCVGATSGQVLATYLLQVLTLSAAGGLLGLFLAAIAAASIPASMLKPFGVTSVGVTWSAALQGIAVGLLVSLLFALVPLMEVRRVKPLLLLRADTAMTARRRDWRSWLAGIVTTAALSLIAVWQAGSLQAGLFVSAGLVIMTAGLFVASHLLVRFSRPLARSPRFALRHAILSLSRPGNQTRVILMAVGVGCFFILGIRAVQANLLHELNFEVGQNSPDFILIDIQPDQVDGVTAAVTPYARSAPRVLPLMRARVVGVDGRRTRLANADAVRQHGELTREYGLTYRNAIQNNERLVAGTFWSGPLTTAKTPDGYDTEVSIEKDVYDDAQVEVGDVMRFDVAGSVLSARVTSIREVSWDEAQNGGFIFVLRPGPAVQRMSHAFVGFLEVLPDPSARVGFQRALVKSFPNVSAIDVREIVRALREVVDNVTLGVTIVGIVMLTGGTLILVGAVAMTKFQRLYDAAIYRTLGAGTRRLAAMVSVEYGVLGTLAGLLGAGGAGVLSWVLARYLFEIDWRPAPVLLASGVILTAALVSLVGLLSSADVLVRKPLGTLKGE